MINHNAFHLTDLLFFLLMFSHKHRMEVESHHLESAVILDLTVNQEPLPFNLAAHNLIFELLPFSYLLLGLCYGLVHILVPLLELSPLLLLLLP